MDHFNACIKRVTVLLVIPLAFASNGWCQNKAVPNFTNRLAAALAAAAIGDGMGAPIEGWHPDQIATVFPNWDCTTFLPSTKSKDLQNGTGKGFGRITDDFLAIEALIRVYTDVENHLDAYSYAEGFVREIGQREVYIPERKDSMITIERPLFHPELYMYHRLVWNQAEPRVAGIGNWLNNGFSGFMLPAGAVNAGDPLRAYQEVAAFGAAHTESFSLEAGAVVAAAYAEAFGPASSVQSVIAVALSLAKDGTKMALAGALSVTDPSDSQAEWNRKIRTVYLKYAQLAPDVLELQDPDVPHMDKSGSNVGRPSRIASIENLPVAFAALKYGEGDYQKTLKAIMHYGRDCESIALIATSIIAAIEGAAVVPEALWLESERENQRSYLGLANDFARTIEAIHQADEAAQERRSNVLNR